MEREIVELDIRYAKEIRVPYPECDIHNHWKLSYIMRAVQQIASDQLDDLGMTFAKLYSEGYVFLLSREYLEFHQGITAGERVTISTWPLPPKGAQFRRNVAIDSGDGQRLMSGYTSWLLVNPESHKILRPASFPYALRYAPVNGEDSMEEQITSLKAPAVVNGTAGASLHVAYSNSDCNGHLNNAVYGDLVLDSIPFEVWEKCRPAAFFVHFIKEAKLGAAVSAAVERAGEQWNFSGMSHRAGAIKEENCFQAFLKLTEL